MKNLNQEDYDFAKLLVEDIVDNSDLSQVKQKILKSIENFDINKKRYFVHHLNALFGNVIMNELHCRRHEAESIANEARLITKELNEKFRMKHS